MTDVRDVLIAARLTCEVFIASDGFPGIRLRTDEEAADLALAALGIDPSTPAGTWFGVAP